MYCKPMKAAICL